MSAPDGRGASGPVPARLGGILLAGGRSRRLGRDKALLVVDGATLLERAVAVLREVADGPVVVAGGDRRRLPRVADGHVADLVPDAGPLSGIAGGLEALGRDVDAAAVLAVDVLAPDAVALRCCAALLGGTDAVIPVVAGRLQPLHAVWRRTEGPSDAVRAGVRSVTAWCRGADVRLVAEDELRAAGADPSRVARDVDVPADLPRGPAT